MDRNKGMQLLYELQCNLFKLHNFKGLLECYDRLQWCTVHVNGTCSYVEMYALCSEDILRHYNDLMYQLREIRFLKIDGQHNVGQYSPIFEQQLNVQSILPKVRSFIRTIEEHNNQAAVSIVHVVYIYITQI